MLFNKKRTGGEPEKGSPEAVAQKKKTPTSATESDELDQLIKDAEAEEQKEKEEEESYQIPRRRQGGCGCGW